MKQTIITIIICLVFTAINYNEKARATDPTILDYSTVSNGLITIGDAENNIQIDTTDGCIMIRGVNLMVSGNNTTNGDMRQIYLSGRLAKLGSLSSNGQGTMLSVNDEEGEITANPKIAGHQLISP
jgi:hypothetical protein